MLSNSSDIHGFIEPSNAATFSEAADSQFGSLSTPISEFPLSLIESIQKLSIRPLERRKFVDLDNTLIPDDIRFVIFPELKNYRGNSAYPKITEKYGSDESNGFSEFVEELNLPENLLKYNEYYDQNDPSDVILTAGNLELQRLKIESAFGENAKRIIVEEAKDKPLAILQYIQSIGYIPGTIIFIDDKIDAFIGMDRKLEKILGNKVYFYRAVPDSINRSVELQSVRQLRHITQARVNGFLLSA